MNTFLRDTTVMITERYSCYQSWNIAGRRDDRKQARTVITSCLCSESIRIMSHLSVTNRYHQSHMSQVLHNKRMMKWPGTVIMALRAHAELLSLYTADVWLTDQKSAAKHWPLCSERWQGHTKEHSLLVKTLNNFPIEGILWHARQFRQRADPIILTTITRTQAPIGRPLSSTYENECLHLWTKYVVGRSGAVHSTKTAKILKLSWLHEVFVNHICVNGHRRQWRCEWCAWWWVLCWYRVRDGSSLVHNSRWPPGRRRHHTWEVRHTP